MNPNSDNAAIRNLKDFLLQYNKISESCFLRCVNNLTDRDLSQDESGCVDMCTRKHISVNHKVMQVYMEVQPQIVNKRLEEMNKQNAALEEAQRKELEASENSEIKKETNTQEVDNKEIIDNSTNTRIGNSGVLTV